MARMKEFLVLGFAHTRQPSIREPTSALARDSPAQCSHWRVTRASSGHNQLATALWDPEMFSFDVERKFWQTPAALVEKLNIDSTLSLAEDPHLVLRFWKEHRGPCNRGRFIILVGKTCDRTFLSRTG